MALSDIKAGAAFVELYLKSNLAPGVRAAQNTLLNLSSTFRSVGGGLMTLGTSAIAPILAGVKAATSIGGQVLDMSERTGLQIESVQELGFAATQTGASFEDLEGVMRHLQQAIGKDNDVFMKIGLSAAALSRMSPEQQFIVVAEKLSKISVEARQTALAMEIFGKSGTKLLPLIRSGAAGIDELRRKARELGLVMSEEDVRASEEFGDTLGVLWQSLKIATASLGVAVLPLLTEFAQLALRCMKAAKEFINENRGWVETFLKIAVATAAVGAGLYWLGIVTHGIALSFGAATAAWRGIVAALGIGRSVIVALFSPLVTLRALWTAITVATRAAAAAALTALRSVAASLMSTAVAVFGFFSSTVGLVVLAIGAATAAVLYFTGAGTQLFKQFAAGWETLKADTTKAIGAIGRALASGNISGAAKVAWSFLKLEWTRGIGWIQEKWAEFTHWVNRTAADAFFGVASAANDAWASLRNGLTGLKSFFKDAWAEIGAAGAKAFNTFDAGSEKLDNALANLRGDITTEELAQRNQAVDERLARDNAAVDAGAEEQKAANERERLARAKEIDDERKKLQGELDAAQADADAKRRGALGDRIRALQEEAHRAVEEFKRSIAEVDEYAASREPKKKPIDPRAIERPSDFDLGKAQGTFSASQIPGLFASDNWQKQTAQNTAQIVKNTAKKRSSPGIVFTGSC